MDFFADKAIDNIVGEEHRDKVISALCTGKRLDEKTIREINAKQVTSKIQVFFDKVDLAKQFCKIQPFFYDKTRMWWFWNFDRKCWEKFDDTDLMLKLKYVCDSANTINSKERNEILEAMKQAGRENLPLEMKGSWIQFKDKIFDIETGEEFEATPDYFATNPIPYELHKEKFIETPKMDEIFEEWVGKEHVKTLYEIIAYCLLPSYPIHRIFCFVGGGMNGKSKFLELLRKFIGTNNCCSTELDSLLQSRFEVSRLHKKLVCQMGETNFNEMSKTSMIKKLSGGDLIGFEYKNKDPFEEINYAKLMISTNNLPATTDKTIGFYRRWMIIDFPNQFTEKKDILKDIPEEEYEMLAVKCCNLLKDLLEKRAFHKEGTIEERIERYESKSNFLGKFMEDYTKENLNGYITKADFFKKFGAWCKENRHREMSETSLGSNMKKIGIESEKKFFNWMYDGKGGQARCWVGITWKEV